MEERRKRGRPLGFDRDKALDLVLPVFWANGLDGSSLDDLATSAGLNRPNLAAAFGGKRELYIASLTRFMGEFSRQTREALSSSNRLKTALAAFFDAALMIYTKNRLGCFLFCTAPAASVADPEIQALVSRGIQITEEAFQEKFRSCPETKDLKPGEMRALATALSGLQVLLALRARTGAASEELALSHRGTTELLLRAIRG